MDTQQYIASGIIETYVMGLCGPAEERQLEQLRRQYPEIDKAIIAYEEQMEKNMLLQSTLPGDEVDSRILSALSNMKRPTAKVVLFDNKKQNRWKVFAAAAVVLLLVSAGLNYYLYRQTKNQTAASTGSLPPGDYEIMKKPTITPVAMYGVGTHTICRCTMFWDKKTGKIYIIIHHLPQSSATKDYQLWAMVDGKPVSIGIVRDEIRGRFIEMSDVPAGATAFLVTLEKAGGSSMPSSAETYLEGRI